MIHALMIGSSMKIRGIGCPQVVKDQIDSHQVNIIGA